VTQPINALAFVFDGINYGASDFAYSAYSMASLPNTSLLPLIFFFIFNKRLVWFIFKSFNHYRISNRLKDSTTATFLLSTDLSMQVSHIISIPPCPQVLVALVSIACLFILSSSQGFIGLWIALSIYMTLRAFAGFWR
jgi:hypothetical protein